MHHSPESQNESQNREEPQNESSIGSADSRESREKASDSGEPQAGAASRSRNDIRRSRLLNSNLGKVFSRFLNRKKRIRVEGPTNEYYETVSDRYALAQILLCILLLIFVAIMAISHASSLTYNHLYYFFRDLSSSVENWDATVSDRIVYAAGDHEVYAPYRGGFAVVGDRYLCAYTATGRRTLYEKSNMKEPVLTASGKYILTYEKNGKSVSLSNSFSRIFKKEFEYTVCTAGVSDSGVFLVVTEGERSSNELFVYGSNQNLLNTVRIPAPTTAVALDATGKTCVYVTASAENGKFVSRFVRFRVGSETQETLAQTEGFVYRCDFLPDGRLLYISDQKLCTLSADGSTETVADTGKSLRLFCMSGSGCAFTREGADGKLTVTVYDGKSLSEHPLDGKATDIQYNGEDLCLLTDTGILRIRKDGSRSLFETDTDGTAISLTGTGTVYLFRGNSAEYITFP